MIIRPATLSDYNQVLTLVKEQLVQYDQLRPDYDKLKYMFNLLVSSRAHFTEVVEDDNGKVVGALMALTSDNLWATKKNCAVLYWSSTLKGTGATLLRHFKIWLKTRPAIRVAGFSPDIDINDRTWALVERLGFKQYGGSYIKYR